MKKRKLEPRFENFLKEWHAKSYQGTDDDMPEAFEGWLADRDTSTLIALANIAIIDAEMRGIERAKEITLQIMTDQDA